MEPRGNHITLIIALTLMLAMLDAGFRFTKIADEVDNAARVHCSLHGQTITCGPETGNAA